MLQQHWKFGMIKELKQLVTFILNRLKKMKLNYVQKPPGQLLVAMGIPLDQCREPFATMKQRHKADLPARVSF